MSVWKKLATKLAQIKITNKMFDFYKVNFEVKIRQNVGLIYEIIKNKDISLLVTTEAAYSKYVSFRASSSFITLTQCQKKYC